MGGTHLAGLEGTNPLGFLAALGVQVAFATEPSQPKLWWSGDVIPHAVTDYEVDDVVEQVMKILPVWRDSPATNPILRDGSAMPKGDELKMSSGDVRLYLDMASRHGPTKGLASSLVAEGSVDGKGAAKPTDLYFTAGQQKFLGIVRSILDGVSAADVRSGLLGPWDYASELPSLGWDVTDDRAYALRARNPSPEKKLTNPGPEALAILGLSTHGVFAKEGRTVTLGCSGRWKSGKYSWPIWSRPASLYSVKSLLAHAQAEDGERQPWFASWSISMILQSHIRRSNQGGYGTFGPPEVVWRRGFNARS